MTESHPRLSGRSRSRAAARAVLHRRSLGVEGSDRRRRGRLRWDRGGSAAGPVQAPPAPSPLSLRGRLRARCMDVCYEARVHRPAAFLKPAQAPSPLSRKAAGCCIGRTLRRRLRADRDGVGVGVAPGLGRQAEGGRGRFQKKTGAASETNPEGTEGPARGRGGAAGCNNDCNVLNMAVHQPQCSSPSVATCRPPQFDCNRARCVTPPRTGLPLIAHGFQLAYPTCDLSRDIGRQQGRHGGQG